MRVQTWCNSNSASSLILNGKQAGGLPISGLLLPMGGASRGQPETVEPERQLGSQLRGQLGHSQELNNAHHTFCTVFKVTLPSSHGHTSTIQTVCWYLTWMC